MTSAVEQIRKAAKEKQLTNREPSKRQQKKARRQSRRVGKKAEEAASGAEWPKGREAGSQPSDPQEPAGGGRIGGWSVAPPDLQEMVPTPLEG